MDADSAAARLPPDAERELVTELARLALEQSAPEELVLFPETVEQYFDDPEAVLAAGRREEAVGFGLDLAMLTPYVLAIATPVVQLLASTVADAAKEEGRPAVRRLVRRLFRLPADDASPAEGTGVLTTEQAARVRDTAYDQAKQLGLDDQRAALLADSLAGRLLVE